MIRAVGILLAVLLIAGTTTAQDSAAGYKVGPLLSFAGDERSSSIWRPSNTIGLRMGLFFARRLSSVFSFETELQFAVKGAESGGWKGMSGGVASFDYLELPVLLNFRPGIDVLEFFTGLYAALLVHHTPIEGHFWTSNRNELESNDAGACLGVRVWIRNTSLELAMLVGFVNVLPEFDRGHYNRTLVFQVGQRFPL